MNILITGSSGFVGKNLIAYLQGPYSLLKLNRETGDLLWSEFDGTNLDRLHIDCIVHLAGKAHDLKNVSNPEEYYRVNYELTKQLYTAFLTSEAKKFVFISSVKAAADSVKGILTENTISDPQTDYGKSKLLAEQFIQRQEIPEGKFVYMLRPSMIHGPGNKGNLNSLYRFIAKGFPYPLAAFKNRRSFLSVENLSFIIKELIDRNDILSGLYNVADDETLSMNEVVTLLSEVMNKKPKLWYIPPFLIQAIAKFGDIVKLPLNTGNLCKLTEDYVVSNYKIKQALKKELPLTAKEALIKTVRSFKHAG